MRAWLFIAAVVFAASPSALLAVGCTNGSSPAATTADSGDAGAVEASPEASLDAGPDIEQDPNVYPADHFSVPQIDYNGGTILEHTRLVTVTFTGDTKRDALRSFDHFLLTTPWWKQTAEGYCIGNGTQCVGDGTTTATDGGVWLPDGSTADGGDGHLDVELAYDFPSNSITDGQVQSWLADHLSAGDFPANDSQTLYALYFPTTTTISTQNGSSCANFGGYHSAAQVGGGAAAYAVIPRCDRGDPATTFAYLTAAASHEIAEAATDPMTGGGAAFYLFSNDAWLGAFTAGGGENGDMCWQGYLTANDSYDESGWTVQRIWSNQAAAGSKNPCQPTSVPYFSAAVRTGKLNVNGHSSYGYIAASRGQSVDVIADVFSEAALPHDLLLYVGKDKGAGHDPSDVAPPGNGITVSLSRQQVHNGNAVILTIAVPTNALPGDTRFIVRSVLEVSDYNDWPVIVHVK